jgi:hypothetical protein
MSSTSTEKPAVSQTTTKRTEKQVNKPQQKPKPKPKPKVSSKGHVLGSPNEKGEEIIDPKEAARRAAEERFQSQNSKQGKLGQQLQQERNKSSRNHLKDLANQKRDENEKNQLIYD